MTPKKILAGIIELITDPKNGLSRFHSAIFNFITKPIYVISYPKAGRTWHQAVFTMMFLDLDFDQVYKVPEYTRRRAGMKRLIYTHGYVYEKNKLAVFFKSLTNKKVIIIIRDPRDVIVSNYFELKLRHKKYENLDDIHSMIQHPIYGIKNIIKYYNDLLEQVKNPVAIIRYENLRQNTEKEMQRLVKILGLNVDPERIKKAVAKNEFKTMQKAVRQSEDIRLKQTVSENPESQKVRRGKIGGYKDYLTPEEQAFVTKESAKLDPRYGYKFDL